MENNGQLLLARRIVEETDANLFLTGKAGTGKTTFLKRLRQASPKRMVVLAPTGIAALNAGGVTIHSFFQLPFSPYLPGATRREQRFKINARKTKLIRCLDLIVIDEVSMVRADLLDAVDDALRRIRRSDAPFGGVQLLLIGDLRQLAPVAKDEEWALLGRHYASPYFFDSHALRATRFATVELTHVYRQSDERFIALLNSVRTGHAEKAALDALNRRFIPSFVPKADEGYVRLVTHNWQADRVNESEMGALPGREFVYDAKVTGAFPEYSYPTEAALRLKCGAQVMFVKNDQAKRYYNGMIGTVVKAGEDGFIVLPKDAPEGGEIEVGRERWENTRYSLDGETGEVRETVDGAFVQFPVKPAWAITIHKSQGLTFDRVMIDASGAFTHGQTYVALSRCRTLEGIVLTAPIPPSAVIADRTVEDFAETAHANPVSEDGLAELRKAYARHLLFRLFGFERERVALAGALRLVEGFAAAAFPETVAAARAGLSHYDLSVMAVAGTFHRQIERMLDACGGDTADAALQERLRKGAGYFLRELGEVERLAGELDFEADNKQFGERRKKLLDELRQSLATHTRLLRLVEQNGFTVKAYLDVRAKAAAQEDGGETGKKAAPAKMAVPTEVKNHALYAALCQWRARKAAERGTPVYAVFSNKALMGLANYCPADLAQLLAVPGIGKGKAAQYGAEALDLVRAFGGKPCETLFHAPEEAAPEEGEEEKPERPAKAAKTPSDLLSLELYQKGMGIPEIAAARQLAESTVTDHLLKHIATGEVDAFRLVPAAHVERIRQALAEWDGAEEGPRLRDIRERAGEDIPYAEIRIVQEAERAAR